ncbi:MAG TPA: arginine repressor [Planctomycetota bacterium]|nr:arginine repressor [Planctomycetota bacterium]
MTATADRRTAVRDLIENGEFQSQSELHQALVKRGIHASQPALSRDLRALKAAKQDGIYTMLPEERVTPLDALQSLVRGHANASHLTLIRTEPGAASAVARAIEADGMPGVTGTIAGDDTVLVATSSQAAARRVRARVAALVS